MMIHGASKYHLARESLTSCTVSAFLVKVPLSFPQHRILGALGRAPFLRDAASTHPWIGYRAPGPGRVRVWLNVYSPTRRSLPVSSKAIKRAIIVSEGAALA